MTVTEEQKQRIDEEEEEYRTKIREESKKSGKKGCSGCIIAVVICAVFLSMILITINPAKQFEQAEKNKLAAPTQDISTAVGKHAYNKLNGTYRGEILEVKQCSSAPELTCYVVNQPTFMRPIEAPVDNSVVKDEAPTPSVQP